MKICYILNGLLLLLFRKVYMYMIIKKAICKDDFQMNAKEYAINMEHRSRRTLHKKNGCYYGTFLSRYVDFDSYEKAKNCGIESIDCQNCFKK